MGREIGDAPFIICESHETKIEAIVKEVFVLCDGEDRFIEPHETFESVLARFNTKYDNVLVENFNIDMIIIRTVCIKSVCSALCKDACKSTYYVYKRMVINNVNAEGIEE